MIRKSNKTHTDQKDDSIITLRRVNKKFLHNVCLEDLNTAKNDGDIVDNDNSSDGMKLYLQLIRSC